MRVYLDHNATTRVDPRVKEAMLPFLEDVWGNPSSIHAEGRAARDAVEKARREVGALVGGEARGVVLTSGGTEAVVLGVVGLARAARKAGRRPVVVASPLEHPAVFGALELLEAEGFESRLVTVDGAGRLDGASLARAVEGGAALVAVAAANHELGNCVDVEEVVTAARAAGAYVFCDAVQAAGKIPVAAAAWDVDGLAVSAHKLHGPKGAGALWLRPGLDMAPLWPGGHQEKGLRPGTESVANVVGLGEAARLAREEGLARAGAMAALRDRLEAACLAVEGSRVHGDVARRVPNTTNVAFTGAPGELVVAALDLEGVACSTGAACTSGSVEPSPVIRALGLPPSAAAEAVRFSLGKDNTASEIDRVAALLPGIVQRIRRAR